VWVDADIEDMAKPSFAPDISDVIGLGDLLPCFQHSELNSSSRIIALASIVPTTESQVVCVNPMVSLGDFTFELISVRATPESGQLAFRVELQSLVDSERIEVGSVIRICDGSVYSMDALLRRRGTQRWFLAVQSVRIDLESGKWNRFELALVLYQEETPVMTTMAIGEEEMGGGVLGRMI